MTALTRVALACGSALIMATAALGALHTAGERERAGITAAPARSSSVRPSPVRPSLPSKVPEPELPSASELDLDLGDLPGGVWATR